MAALRAIPVETFSPGLGPTRRSTLCTSRILSSTLATRPRSWTCGSGGVSTGVGDERGMPGTTVFCSWTALPAALLPLLWKCKLTQGQGARGPEAVAPVGVGAGPYSGVTAMASPLVSRILWITSAASGPARSARACRKRSKCRAASSGTSSSSIRAR